MRITTKPQSGFTIIELLIASTIFSIIMLICLGAFIAVGRMYYKGVTITRTQSVARSVIDDLSRAIQFSDASVGTAANTYCVGSKRYTIALNKEVNTNPADTYFQGVHALQREDGYNGGCAAAVVDAQGGVASSTELLSEGMQLDAFSITDISGGTGKLWQIHVKVVSGSNLPNQYILSGANGSKACFSNGTGTQFCAVSDLTTIVTGRL